MIVQGSVRRGSELVRSYFWSDLRMAFLEQVCMGWWLSGGEGLGVGHVEGGKGFGSNNPTEGEGWSNRVGGCSGEGGYTSKVGYTGKGEAVWQGCMGKVICTSREEAAW